MNNALLMLGALLVGILAALVAVPMMIDWNGYRGVFEEEASRLMGRDVRLGGGVVVRVLPVPYVRFEKLRIADTESTGGDPLFRAESVTMRLSIAPLLRGVLEAQSVELKKPSLRLTVDAEGRGNWRSLTLQPGSLPFVPADVKLQSVGIEDGTLLVVGAGAKDLAQFDAISGEFAADGVEGPFRFKGNAIWYGEARDIRISTAKPEADGSTRLRASVRVPANQNSYGFDGRVIDLKGRPRVDGDLSAKLPIALATAARPGAEPDGNAFELKAKVEGDLGGGQLSAIELALDQPGDPQLVTGLVNAAWGDMLRFDIALASRSFNLDRFAADKAAPDPLATVRSGLALILSMLPAQADTDATLKADRVSLAGETVTGVAIAVSRRAGLLDVKELRAQLPGGTRLDASGVINRDGGSTGFTGPVLLRGANLARFLAWVHKSGPVAAGRYEGAFALEGQLAMSAGAIELARANGEIAGLPLSGSLRYVTEGRRRLKIALQGQRIDAAQVWPGGFDSAALRMLLAGGRSDSAHPGGLFGYDPTSGDLEMEVRAGELQLTAETDLRDVDMAFEVDRGKLSAPRIRFATATGLGVEIDGSLNGLARQTAPPGASGAAPPAPRGTVRFVVQVPGKAAAAELMESIESLVAVRAGESVRAVVSSIGTARIAGSAAIGERRGDAVDVTFDGMVDGGRVNGSARLDQGITAWRGAPLELTATIETGSVDRWFGLAGLPKPAVNRPARPGQILVKVDGIAQTGATAIVAAAADGLSVVYQGAVTAPREGALALDGNASINARDAADAVALAALDFGRGAAPVPLMGLIAVKMDGDRLTLASDDLRIGPAVLRGRASLRAATKAGASGAPVGREIDAAVAVDAITLTGLLQTLADRRGDGSGAGIGGRSVWPDQPLSLTAFDGLQGKVAVSAARFAVDGTVVLSDLRAVIDLAPGAIRIGEITAGGLGGTINANLALGRSPAGLALDGDWSIAGASLAGHGTPLAVAATGTFKSQGLSASGLVAGLEGKGEATLGPGTVKAVAPAALAALVETALTAKVPPTGEDLAQAVRTALAASSLDVPVRRVAFALADGIARLPAISFATREGRASLEGTLDLNAMRFSTDWRIEAAAKPGVTGKPKVPLPAVVVSTTGPVAAMAEADTRLTIAAFEQELSVRKLERDVEELERLRKLDEDRRQKEENDRRAAEAAAQAALDAAAAGAGPNPNGAAAPGAAGQPPTSAEPGTALPPAAGDDGAKAALPGTANTTARPSGLTRQPAQGAAARHRALDDGLPQPLRNNY